jgi:hypothetical protein
VPNPLPIDWATAFPMFRPSWVCRTLSYTDFAAASTTNSVDVFDLPAGMVVHGCKVRHTVSFTGPGITAYTVLVGAAGGSFSYGGLSPSGAAVPPTGWDIHQAPGPGVSYVGMIVDTTAADESMGGATIQATATSVGANLNAATAGSVAVWLLISLPSVNAFADG